MKQRKKQRVLKAEKVPAEEKIGSIFEEHTDTIKKANPTEFGHKVLLAWTGNGILNALEIRRSSILIAPKVT